MIRKIIRKSVTGLAAVIIALFAVVLSVAAGAAEGTSGANTEPVNVILIIDKSGSMRRTDQEGQAKSAASEFLDILASPNQSENLSAVTNVAILAFNNNFEEISGFTSIKDDASRDYMKSRISEIEYEKGSDTDIGKVLNHAAQMLKEQDPDGRNLIFLFTDGKTDFTAGRYKTPLNELFEKSANNKATAINKLSSMSRTEVVALGWNYQNSLEAEGKQEIMDITNTLQSKDGLMARDPSDQNGKFPNANYLITDNMVYAREFMAAEAERLRGGIVTVFDKEFEIESSEVVEPHVILSSNEKIEGINIISPSGEKLEPGEKYSEEGDDFYKVCKLFTPDLGKYTVQIQGADEDSVSKLLVRLYAVEAKMNVEQVPDDGSYGTGAPYAGLVKVTPVYKGQPYTEPTFISSVTTKEAYVTAPETSGTGVTSYPLEYDNTENCFTCAFPILEDGTYGVEATIANDKMTRTVVVELDTDTGITRNSDGSFTKSIENITVKRGKTLEWEPESNLKFLTLQNVSTDDPAFAETHIKPGAGAVTIKGKKKGETPLSIAAQDKNGNDWHLEGKVIVNFALTLPEIILIILVIALIAALIFFLLKRMKSGDGLINGKIRNMRTGYSEEFSIIPPKGSSFKLWIIANQVIERMRASSGGRLTGDQNTLIGMMERRKKELESYKMVLTKKKSIDGSKQDAYECIHDKYTNDLSLPVFQDQELLIDLTFVPSGVDGFNTHGPAEPMFGDQQRGFGDQGGFGGQGGFGDQGSQQGGFGNQGGAWDQGSQQGGFGSQGGAWDQGGQQGGFGNQDGQSGQGGFGGNGW